MNEQIGLGAFGTFGEPFGYQQVFFLTTALRSQLDLNTNAIEVYPGSELYAVKREVTDGVSSVCCCLYSYAKEPNSNRGGTFVGACVVLRNSYLNGEDIHTLLKELHTDLISNPKNIADNTLQVQKAEQLVVTEPSSFTRIKANRVAANIAKTIPVDAQSKFLIQAAADTATVPAFIDTAIRYFTHTDTLYFTADKRIISYVAEKGIIPAVDWETFQDYKKQIVQQQKEAVKKAEALKKGEGNQAVAKSVKTAVKSTANKTIPAFGILEPWTNADVPLSKEAFGKMVQNHNTLLEEYRKLLHQPIAAESFARNNGHPATTSSRPRFRPKRKHLMLTIIVLFVLLITTSVLLLLRSYSPSREADVAANTLPVVDSASSASKVLIPQALVPLSNTELAKADVSKMAKEKIKGKKLEVIADLLFIRNPKSIGEVYLGQKEAYAASLLQQNKSCFKEDSAGFTCTCDTLLHLPAFKK